MGSLPSAIPAESSSPVQLLIRTLLFCSALAPQISKIIETLSQQLQTKGRELNEFREKHNIRLMGEDDQKAPSKESPEGAGAKASSAGVLVS